MGDCQILKTLIKLLLLPLIIFCFSGPVNAQDPFKDITSHELSNGLTVVLAPNEKAKNLTIQARVKVGKIVEYKHNLGVSHLLEHLLFRDSRFEEGQTYNELIKEAGGVINAEVGYLETAYYSTIPSSNGNWLVAQFAKMLFENTVDDEDLKHAKSSVELEIGEPSWAAAFLDNEIASTFLKLLMPKDFLESEFRISFPKYLGDKYRLSNRRLTRKQIEEHYSSYYRPSNIVLFIAGNFMHEDMIKLVENTYGKYDDRPGKTIPEITPEPTVTPYHRVEFEPEGQHYIVAGTKTLNLNAKERMVLNSYLEYVAHRLMINLRNKYGETYTAHSQNFQRFGAGYGVVSFETKSTELKKNLDYVKSLFDEEARSGNLSDEDIKEAISLYKNLYYELADVDAETMLDLAEHFYYFRTNFRTTQSPYSVLTSISPDDFRAGLRNIFLPDRSYTRLYIPYMYSKIEFVLLVVFSIISPFIVIRIILKKKTIDETRIRWVTRTNLSPGVFIEILPPCLFFFPLLFFFIFIPINKFIETTRWYYTSGLWPNYFSAFFSIFITFSLYFYYVILIPKKLQIEDNYFVIKSITYYARKFEIDTIKSIRSLSVFRLIASPKIWVNSRFRWRYNFLFLWRKGLLLGINDGPVYFIGVKDANKTVAELAQFINQPLKTSSDCKLEPDICE